jgi:hypothetical protein
VEGGVNIQNEMSNSQQVVFFPAWEMGIKLTIFHNKKRVKYYKTYAFRINMEFAS